MISVPQDVDVRPLISEKGGSSCKSPKSRWSVKTAAQLLMMFWAKGREIWAKLELPVESCAEGIALPPQLTLTYLDSDQLT